ncbi:hypothetical protein QIS74_09201 [Colletotrichum tabaci]|uniref:Uncharacterized protein n=2 Tax=Colletotrichum destructivum species complex TaxID=2707350 RepID=A0AAV9T3P3_9PEZI|nr:hypothetical protein CDEST_10343 [Colletotrichum destructivum]GJD00017.1 hypothetical protein ColKHC_08842 [Colletotrichum higginsianum]
MRFSLACTAAFVASLATANPLATRNQISWEFPESMSVAKRQDVPAPGTPAYLCHENCGTSITLSREAGYCTNYLWISRYDACLQCANTHNIWQYYSNSITASAAACGFTAVPV